MRRDVTITQAKALLEVLHIYECNIVVGGRELALKWVEYVENPYDGSWELRQWTLRNTGPVTVVRNAEILSAYVEFENLVLRTETYDLIVTLCNKLSGLFMVMDRVLSQTE